MAQLIFGHDEALAQWAEREYPDAAPLMRPLHCIGIADNERNKLWAVAIYNNHTRTNVDFSMVALNPRWATRGTIRALAWYPFRQLGLKRMTALTTKRNKRARAVLGKIGFEQEGVHPYAFPTGEKAVSYGLYHDVAERKWINGNRRG